MNSPCRLCTCPPASDDSPCRLCPTPSTVASKTESTINLITTEMKFNRDFKYLCPITLRGFRCYGMLDSGNLMVNAISTAFAKLLFQTDDLSKHIRPMEECQTIGTAKKGAQLKVLGTVRRQLPLFFGDVNIPFKTRPIVVEGLNMHFNISGPFMAKNKIDQIHSQGVLRIRKKFVKLYHARDVPVMVKQHADSEMTNSAKVAGMMHSESEVAGLPELPEGNAYVLEDLEIPAMSAKFVRVQIPDIIAGCLPAGAGILAGNVEFMERTDTHPTLYAVVQANSDGIATSSILNTKDRTVVIPRGMRFGTFTPAVAAYKHHLTPWRVNLITLADAQGEKKKYVPPPAPAAHVDRAPPGSEAQKEWLTEAFQLHKAPWLKDDPQALKQALDLLIQYDDIFSRNDEYGRTDLITHRIITEDGLPIRQKGKPINPVLQKDLQHQIDKWLEQGVIEPSQSPWSFGLLAVPKKNGRLRWVIDFRALNARTVRDSFPLPNIEDNLARLAKSKVFSGVDGTGAYHVIPIDPRDRMKTAFSTPMGLYHFRTMAFGLMNAPASYCRLMQMVFEGIPSSVALNYLDDSAIHSIDVPSHLKALAMVFEAHRKAGLMIQPAKCQLFRKEIEYLGHWITADGIQPLQDYIKDVTEWPEPNTAATLRTFLGKISYYRKFIRHFSHLAAPLYTLLCKDVVPEKGQVLTLTKEAQNSFLKLRKALTEAPILAYPDFESEEPFILDTDWSHDPGAIGGVLSQVQQGHERVISYGARKLTKSERNYSSNKGEILAAIHFIRHWRYYFQHRPFVLRTDHIALKWLKTMDEPKGMTLRWLETLGNHEFTIQFRPGVKHGNADGMSRIEHARAPTEAEEKESENEAMYTLQSLVYSTPITEAELLEAQQEEDELKQVRTWLETGTKPSRREIRDQSLVLRQYLAIMECLYISRGGLIRRQAQTGEFYKHDRLCLPRKYILEAIKACHEATGGHMGIANTRHRFLQRFYRPGCNKDVEAIVSQCQVCQQKRGFPKPQKDLLASTTDGTPFQRLAIDFVGPMRESDKGNFFLFTVKCTFTKWVEAFPLPQITAVAAVSLLEKEIFSRFGMPSQIHADQGSQFTAAIFEEILAGLGIAKTHTPAYNPKSLPVERTHRDLHSVVKALCTDTGQDWEEVLPMALFAIRTARHSATTVTPFFAMYGREAKMPIDCIFPNTLERKMHVTEYAHRLRRRMNSAFQHMREKMQMATERSRMHYSGRLTGREIVEDDLVWLFTPRVKPGGNRKTTMWWSGPWRITQKISDVLFRVCNHGDWNRATIDVVVSIDRLKQYRAPIGALPRQDQLTQRDVALQDEFLEDAIFPDEPPDVIDRPVILGSGAAAAQPVVADEHLNLPDEVYQGAIEEPAHLVVQQRVQEPLQPLPHDETPIDVERIIPPPPMQIHPAEPIDIDAAAAATEALRLPENIALPDIDEDEEVSSEPNSLGGQYRRIYPDLDNLDSDSTLPSRSMHSPTAPPKEVSTDGESRRLSPVQSPPPTVPTAPSSPPFDRRETRAMRLARVTKQFLEGDEASRSRQASRQTRQDPRSASVGERGRATASTSTPTAASTTTKSRSKVQKKGMSDDAAKGRRTRSKRTRASDSTTSTSSATGRPTTTKQSLTRVDSDDST